jgi:hypothetical protein
MTICNRKALAVVGVPTEAEEQLRAIHRQHENKAKMDALFSPTVPPLERFDRYLDVDYQLLTDINPLL